MTSSSGPKKANRGARLSLNSSLRLRVTLATALAFVGLGVVVCVVLPRAYAEQVRESLRERTRVLSRTADPLAKILERVARGESRAVQECIDAYGGLLWTLARRILRDSHEAEDAVQEILVEPAERIVLLAQVAG